MIGWVAPRGLVPQFMEAAPCLLGYAAVGVMTRPSFSTVAKEATRKGDESGVG